ncbi:metal ABC transporter substrate-binding protein [Halothermothrix orenii]|uniref:Periplasmic solute binding protein n=1 Tax=Halothermothrix orenii (strain H 168 / OCM 544 / DSM 9562) TaxID=373903 RepID=B8CZ65_HALOH|nr:metal ABC transporter substrate-binding protein [Halothermothrix orenii]ACL70584.1 periplasmic solute binding protein [Halothermothrix orenii H 168]
MKKIYILVFLVIIFFPVLFIGLKGDERSGVVSDKLKVITSVNILEDFVKEIGGEKVEVESLITGLETPHTFSMSPGDRKKLMEADMIVTIGMGLEVWIDDILKEIASEKIIVTTSRVPGIKVIGGSVDDEHGHDNHNHGNPHIWLNPDNARLMITAIKDSLIKADPVNKEYYTKNYKYYLSELNTEILELKNRVARLDDRRVFSYAAAFPYLLDYFGFETPLPSRVVPGQDISAREITSLIKQLKKEDIEVIIEARQSGSKIAETLARETGGKVVYLTPLLIPEIIPETGSYKGLIRYNIETIINVLK